MDALEGSPDYALDVAVVDLSEAQERHANVLLNNSSAMGDWDLEALRELLGSDGFDAAVAGFDRMDLELLFPDAPEIGSLFADAAASPDAAALEAAIGAIRPQDADHHDKRKASRLAAEARLKEESDTERYAVVVFASREAAQAWIVEMGAEPGTRYVSGESVRARMRASDSGTSTE